ncbi:MULTISPECIES: extracellular solute-binding protein [unclassified Ensifer]|uniref:ABC transporter substrate-binding protein n=1 Tax=unclassified Ensifer TaxID=2633371 RepID=UPI00042E9323|nr:MULTISPECIES: extracellular solute-binding protein [unclassified Ensifer]AHK46711.1 putative bacterial extracellular solute-binding protein [Ensifer adhaerens OV14]MBD9489359.1 extracellular solute-binding protein [Ensifer sp. ENS11]MDP9629465.1 raffinose/stachyose/melibiose transport system substrate-binding protein [Ensifer adhaerens]
MGLKRLLIAGAAMVLTALPAAAGELSFWHAYAGQQDKVDFINFALDEFAKAHPDIKLDVVAAEQSAYKTKLNTAMASGNPPDVFYTLPGGFLNAFVNGGQMYALDADLAKDGWGDSFLESALAQTSKDGHAYAVPVDVDSVVFWYDKALFAEKGWTVPSSYDELLALAETIKGAGIVPFALGNKDAWPATFWFQYLEMRLKGSGVVSAFVNKDAKAALGDEATKALEHVAALSSKGYFPIGFNGMGDQEANMLFLNGQAAMMLNGTWQIGASADAPEGFELGYFAFPTVKDGAGDQSDVLAGVAATFGISQKAENKADAVTLLKFLTSSQVMTKYVELRKTMVTVKDATTEAAAGPVLFDISGKLMAKAGHLDPFYDTAMPPAATNIYYTSLQGVLDGSVPPADAAKRLEDALRTDK